MRHLKHTHTHTCMGAFTHNSAALWCGSQEGDGISPTAVREIMLLRELDHENVVALDSVHINRLEPSLWLAFEYAEHDLYEMIKFHRDNRDLRRDNPYGECLGGWRLKGLRAVSGQVLYVVLWLDE